MSEAPPTVKGAPKGKGPPPKGLGKGAPPPLGLGGKGAPPTRPASKEALGPKLRPLFWTAVSQVSTESVWNDLVEPAPFDKALLERQFALADTRTATAVAGSRST